NWVAGLSGIHTNTPIPESGRSGENSSDSTLSVGQRGIAGLKGGCYLYSKRFIIDYHDFG
ncbi:MAG: hypothetical protein NTY36_13065, partial [Deltaproteobacteria bacterium]|nr:hypothetical protein [Deltaproteobacteria bacterium]